VAVVGANDRPDSYAGAVLENLERAGFAGPVWGVNPNRSEAMGRPCVASLGELPEAVDAVVVAIPAAGVPAAVRAAGDRGCGGAVVLSAGFGEIASGRALERALRDAALAVGLPVCGPNGNGIVAVGSRAPLWGDSVAPLEPGAVAMVTQSGNAGVNALGSRRGIDWHTIVSTGNQTVCDASDWLEALATRDGVRSVALFLEADGDGRRLCEALAACVENGVGVAVLKVGSSAAGARAATAHTGALAGDQRVFRALVEEAGAAWATDPHELLELARVLAHPAARPRRAGGLAVLTCSGGDAGVASDEAERLGLDLPDPAPVTASRLERLLPSAATIANPLDYTAMLWDDLGALRGVVRIVGDDPGIDQLLLLYDHPTGLSEAAELVWRGVREALVSGAEESRAAALLASTLPDLIDERAARELARRDVPAVGGLRTGLACARALRLPRADPARLREIGVAAQARGRGDGRWIGEVEAKAMLSEAGVPVPAGRTCADAEECVEAARALGYPVALKLSGPAVRHKSDTGALALALDGDEAVRAACSRLLASPAADGAELLVERMVATGTELIVAARADGVVPALVVGLGGLWTEALDDVAIIPLPARPERVARALRSLRGAGMLDGGRGGPTVDLAGAAELAAATGRLLLERGLELIELNPVAVNVDGAVAVDALAHT